MARKSRSVLLLIELSGKDCLVFTEPENSVLVAEVWRNKTDCKVFSLKNVGAVASEQIVKIQFSKVT
jgi:hypothetical protein